MEFGGRSASSLGRSCASRFRCKTFSQLLGKERQVKGFPRALSKVIVASDVLEDPEPLPNGSSSSEEAHRGVAEQRGEKYRVQSAEFVKSSVKLSQCPPPTLPEIAVIGRSNVGKSSLINTITNRKQLALVSKTPGKTVCINHFIINKDWYLVDLPGYGFAKRSKTERFEWLDFTKDYFLHRETLANVLLLVDCSIPPQQIDIDCADWMGEHKVPLSIVFTKCDKRKKKAPTHSENITLFRDMMRESWENLPPMLITSSVKGTGKQELLSHLGRVRQYWKSALE